MEQEQRPDLEDIHTVAKRNKTTPKLLVRIAIQLGIPVDSNPQFKEVLENTRSKLSKGGVARAAMLTPEEHIALGRHGVEVREKRKADRINTQ